MPSERQPYKTVILFVAGFTQRRSPSNGIHRAFDRTYRQYANSTTLVLYYQWFVGAAEIAAMLERLSIETYRESNGETRLRIVIASYSFGCWTALQICRLFATGPASTFVVDELILCDPVGRWFRRIGWTRALVPSTVTVRENVRTCIWIQQANPRFSFSRMRNGGLFFSPAGHRVRLADSAQTRLVGPFTLPCQHTEIDDSGIFGDYVEDAIHRQVVLAQ